MNCNDKDQLLEYLYEEATPAVREEVEAHLAGCAACRTELEKLTVIRTGLAAWAPPQAPRFRVVVEPGLPLRRAWTRPAFGYAAAALILLCALSAVVNLDVTRDAQGWRVRTSLRPPQIVASGAAVPAQNQSGPGLARRQDAGGAISAEVVTEPVLRAALADLEAKLERERDVRRTQPAAVDLERMRAETTQMVRALIAESEARQRRDTAVVVRDLISDLDSQRRADLRRIEANFGALEGRTGEEVARAHQLVKYLIDTRKR